MFENSVSCSVWGGLVCEATAGVRQSCLAIDERIGLHRDAPHSWEVRSGLHSSHGCFHSGDSGIKGADERPSMYHTDLRIRQSLG
jgi:hypothetical protein